MSSVDQSRPKVSPTRFPVIFTAGFRFYFLAAGLFSVFAMSAWIHWLGVGAADGFLVTLPMTMAPYLWHAHEMMYGYTIAVMAGFFVTAVPSWTGTKEAGALFVTISATVWLLGRLVIWFSSIIDPIWVAVIDLSFIPVLASAILGRLAKKSQTRNAVFLLLLSILFAGNFMMHLDWIGWTEGTAETGARLGIFASAAMIAIIGGRVVPAFTRNALNRIEYTGGLPRSYPWLDRASILLAIGAALTSLPIVPESVFGAMCIAAGIANLVRLAGWKGMATLKSPILWILHVAYLLLCTGYLLFGISVAFAIFDQTAVLHLISVGAVGSMTLAMMTRASLGHSGRPLKVSGAIVAAYLAIIIAAIIRSFGHLYWDYYSTILISGALWICGFALFSVVFFPILTRPRSSRQT